MQVYCPFCEGQGEIYKTRIKATREIIYICGECDTVWHTASIDTINCQPFDCMMLNKGLKPLWCELDNIQKYKR